MRKIGLAVLLLALVGADIWTLWTLGNAIGNADGYGFTLWAAIMFIAALFIGLLWATVRVAQRWRATFASRFARPS